MYYSLEEIQPSTKWCQYCTVLLTRLTYYHVTKFWSQCVLGSVHWNMWHDFKSGDTSCTSVYVKFNVCTCIVHVFSLNSGVLVEWVQCVEVCWWPFCNSMLWTSLSGKENQEKGSYMCMYSYSQVPFVTLSLSIWHVIMIWLWLFTMNDFLLSVLLHCVEPSLLMRSTNVNPQIRFVACYRPTCKCTRNTLWFCDGEVINLHSE